MIVPPDKLAPDTLLNLMEEYITREGTDYGDVELDLEAKTANLKRQLDKGEVLIVFDALTESVSLITAIEYQQWADCNNGRDDN